MVERFQNYIGGKFVDAGDGRTFDSLDPYAGSPWTAIPEGSVGPTAWTPCGSTPTACSAPARR